MTAGIRNTTAAQFTPAYPAPAYASPTFPSKDGDSQLVLPQLGRLRPVRFSSQYLPAGFQVTRSKRRDVNGSTWLFAVFAAKSRLRSLIGNLDYVLAEVTERSMKLSLLAAALAMPIAASANEAPAPQAAVSSQITACELHVFPTNEIIDSSNGYNDSDHGLAGVLIGGLLSSAQSGGTGKLKASALEQMKEYLPPAVQIEELKIAGVLSVLKLPADTKIVEEAALPRAYQTPSDPALFPAYGEYMTALKKSRAIKPSTSTCYRELIVVSLSVAKNLGTLKITSEFVYRTFDAQYVETHLYDGENSVPKPDRFPAQPGVSDAEAEAAVKEAFRTNFVRWVARRVKT